MVRHWFRKPAGEIPLQVRVLHPPPSKIYARNTADNGIKTSLKYLEVLFF